MSIEQFEGQGGSYVLGPDGTRQKIGGTTDKLDTVFVEEDPINEPAPAALEDNSQEH